METNNFVKTKDVENLAITKKSIKGEYIRVLRRSSVRGGLVTLHVFKLDSTEEIAVVGHNDLNKKISKYKPGDFLEIKYNADGLRHNYSVSLYK